tara:strand:+ start:4818 stop:6890 length:2073 start_codon:yes stop_codon:yes gene_type:complete
MTIEGTLPKSEFIGKDGYEWFIAQVTTDKSWREYSLKHGYRAKIRILGHHPADATIPDSELPWAHFLVSPNFGAGNNFGGQSFALQGGETVFGFFLDGEDRQQPVVMGAFNAGPHVGKPVDFGTVTAANTSFFEAISIDKNTEFGSHITPTGKEHPNNTGGLTDENNKVDGAKGGKVETNLSKLNDEVIEVRVAQKCTLPNNAFSDITKEMKGFMSILQNLEQTANGGYIDKVFNKVILASEFDQIVDQAASKITGGLALTTRLARKELFAGINKVVDENLSFLDPDYLMRKMGIEDELGAISCLTENLLAGFSKTVKDLLKEMAGKLVNFPLCAAEQLISGLSSKLTDLIDGGISGSLGGIGSLSGGSMPNFGDSFSKILGQLQTGLALLECEPSACEPDPTDWAMNSGPSPVKGLDMGRIKSLSGAITALPGGLAGKIFPGLDSVSNAFGILDSIDGLAENMQKRMQDLDISNAAFGMEQLVGGCDPFTKKCGPPRVEIFGGGGIGAFGKAIINNTGRIVGVDMENLGVGYTEPPYVTFIDECDNGGGATGKAIIEDGQVVQIIMQETGGGYLGPESSLSDEEGIDVVGVIDGIDVIGTGTGYSEGDTITTDDGQLLEPVLAGGRIIGATPVNVIVGLNELPKLQINTSTGFGAIIRPTVKFTKVSEFEDPIVPETKVIRVIDCPRGY